MILDRFDAVVFVGDDSLKHIYAAFNMLLRENIATGSLRRRDLTQKDQTACRCDNQFTSPECSVQIATESQAISDGSTTTELKSPYYCDRKN